MSSKQRLTLHIALALIVLLAFALSYLLAPAARGAQLAATPMYASPVASTNVAVNQALEPRARLPIVRVPTFSASLTTLVDTDAGFVAAALVPNTRRVIVGYIDRRNGNVLHIGEDVGDRLVELADPMLAALVMADVSSGANSPSFVYPGPKQGTAAIVVIGNELRIYATARDEGDPTGPFKVKRLSMPLPPAP